VFGTKHLSWKCFLRSSLASFCLFAVTTCVYFWWPRIGYRRPGVGLLASVVLPTGLIGNVFPDYISLLESRYILKLMRRTQRSDVEGQRLPRRKYSISGFLVLDLLFTLGLATFASMAANVLFTALLYRDIPGAAVDLKGLLSDLKVEITFLLSLLANPKRILSTRLQYMIIWMSPAFFTSIWLWLYAGSGFLLKFARRFDKSLGWFNRRFDIEKKPLQAIGLVAGALVALIYWAAVIVGRII
jgi:hypothetical protein